MPAPVPLPLVALARQAEFSRVDPLFRVTVAPLDKSQLAEQNLAATAALFVTEYGEHPNQGTVPFPCRCGGFHV